VVDILISGSSGLIGTRLRQALRDAGHRPIRLVRPSTSDRSGDTAVWEPSEGRIDAAALEGIDAVVNLAGVSLFGRWTDARRKRIRDSRVLGTRLLAETIAGLDRPPATFATGSAIGYYGARGDEILTEDASAGEGFLADVVREMEAAAAPAEEAGVRVIHLRTAPALASDADVMKLQVIPAKLGLGGKLGSGKQWFPWIHLEDHVRATVSLLEHPSATGPFNLAAPNPVRHEEFASTLGDVLNRPSVLTLPLPVVALVFGRTAAEEFAAASQRVVPQRLMDELGFTFRYPDLEAALRQVLDRPAAA
jgi:uncharacterized protein